MNQENKEIIPQTNSVLSLYNEEQKQLIKNQIAPNATDLELIYFLTYCQKTKLDPIARQIYAIKRGNKLTIQTSIDGFRVIAQRTGEYEGQLGPFWCGEDGIWKDVWNKNIVPFASKVGVLRKGFKEPLWGVANFKSYNQGVMNWKSMPEHMIAKVAEALALRKAFPNELSNIYSNDEMPPNNENEEKQASYSPSSQNKIMDQSKQKPNPLDQLFFEKKKKYNLTDETVRGIIDLLTKKKFNQLSDQELKMVIDYMDKNHDPQKEIL